MIRSITAAAPPGPRWAGPASALRAGRPLIAIANQGRVLNGLGTLDSFQQTLTRLYQLSASDFHDITSGNNGYPAGPGYDLVTGLGSPLANLLVPDLAHAYTPATLTWTGGGMTSNWSDPNNWGGTKPNPGDNLVFGPGAANLKPYDDFPAGTSFSSVAFSGSGYTVSGNSIVTEQIDGSNATGANTLNVNFTLGNAGTINAGGSATTLTLGGTINESGFNLEIGGGSGAVTFAGLLDGNDGLTDDSPGTVTFQGNTTISSLTLSGGTLATGSSTLTLTGSVYSSGSSSIAGSLALAAGVSTFSVASSSTLTVSAAISGSSTLSMTGPGTLALSGVNSYTGNTTLSAGTLVVTNSSALGSGTLTLTGSTTLQAGGGGVSLPNPVSLGGTVTLPAGSNLTLSGPVTLTGNRTLSINSGLVLTLSGTVGQSGGNWSLTKAGAGTLTMNGTGSYGSTVLNAGTLTVGNVNALGSGALTLTSGILQAGNAPLSLANAATLKNVTLGGSYNVTFTGPVSASGTTTAAGSDNLSLSGPVTLTGNWTVSVGAGLVTTLSRTVGQSGGSWSLTKAGSGTLVLSGTGSYGSTVLNGGTLTIANSNALSSGALSLMSGTFQAGSGPLSLANAVTLGSVTLGGSYNVTFTGAVSASGTTTAAGSDNLAALQSRHLDGQLGAVRRRRPDDGCHGKRRAIRRKLDADEVRFRHASPSWHELQCGHDTHPRCPRARQGKRPRQRRVDPERRHLRGEQCSPHVGQHGQPGQRNHRRQLQCHLYRPGHADRQSGSGRQRQLHAHRSHHPDR